MEYLIFLFKVVRRKVHLIILVQKYQKIGKFAPPEKEIHFIFLKWSFKFKQPK